MTRPALFLIALLLLAGCQKPDCPSAQPWIPCKEKR